ncbi:RNA polymerase sigma factor SigI [Paenibacillus sp. CCS19]|uniref:RNA polymerase sigma factor SigI n=1 Tax=Paenibacillus sp. CCS19 TaxID=3158387 RepID=UPI002566CCC9|nr:RNA polymerase sigma factor SigI [Paenibacillus cellulosilyticus]GMK41850.1 RNA polymerase sigma factor SigI [Paenibacillus cellulosilyticus]
MTRLLLVLFRRFISKVSGEKSSKKQETDLPEQTIERIRNGDEHARAELIAQYEPYILKVTSKFSKRYINPQQDDEYSVAIIAFNEAIDGFSASAGRSFLGFAETVIRRRLIDYVRKEQRHTQSVPYSAFDMEDDEQTVTNKVETSQAQQQFSRDREKEERKQEILELSAKLAQFGISFSDLVDQAPKHTDTRSMLFGIGRMATEARFYDSIMDKGRLPVTELAEQAGVSRKTIERNRKYIIALAIIHKGSYPYIQAYVQQMPPQAIKQHTAQEVKW